MKKNSIVALSVVLAGACGVALAAAGHNVYFHGDAISHNLAMVG